MAIAKMKQFTLLAFHDHRDNLLRELQRFGDAHFKNLQKEELEEFEFLGRDAAPQRIAHLEAELNVVNAVLGTLAPHAPKKPMTAKRPTLSFEEFDRYGEGYDYRAVCEKVESASGRIATIRGEKSRLESENETLRQWLALDISPAELEKLSVVRPLIGTVNKKQTGEFERLVCGEFDCVYMESLGAIKEEMTLLLLIPSEQYDDVFDLAKKNGFAKSNLSFEGVPAEIIAENGAQADRIDREIQEKTAEIQAQGGEHENLLIVRDALMTALAREKAIENFMRTDLVTLIEGWIPEAEEPVFRSAVDTICGEDCYLELTEVEQTSSTVPIKLRNNPFVSAFESITSMYSMPLYSEFDPTPVLAPCYWLFFGFMAGDIGYGLVLMAATFGALKFLDLKDGMKGMLKMFFYLSFSVTLSGFLYGGVFGETIFKPLIGADGQPKAILDSNLDIVTMLILSIVIGVMHIILGLIVKAATCLKNGDPLGALFDGVFWIITLLSGIGFLLGLAGIVEPGIGEPCKWVFYASLVGLAATQGRDSPSLGGKIGNGLYGVYGLSGYVGDVVSYTRIVALALSGAYIGFSFNLMAGLLPGGLGWIAKALILVLGHLINFGLALLGAYVHTCRLQYVEFFGKFFEGGGVPFQPLKVQNEYTHITSK